jgi:hypothetical protein
MPFCFPEKAVALPRSHSQVSLPRFHLQRSSPPFLLMFNLSIISTHLLFTFATLPVLRSFQVQVFIWHLMVPVTKTFSVATLGLNSMQIDDHTFVRAFLPFKSTSCFGLSDNLWYRLAHQDNWYALNAGIPALTLAWVFNHIFHCLVEIRNANSEIFQPKQFSAPAVTIQAFVSGAISVRIPKHSRWIAMQDANPEF